MEGSSERERERREGEEKETRREWWICQLPKFLGLSMSPTAVNKLVLMNGQIYLSNEF